MPEEDLSVCEMVLKELEYAEFELKSRHDKRVLARLKERILEFIEREGDNG